MKYTLAYIAAIGILLYAVDFAMVPLLLMAMYLPVSYFIEKFEADLAGFTRFRGMPGKALMLELGLIALVSIYAFVIFIQFNGGAGEREMDEILAKLIASYPGKEVYETQLRENGYSDAVLLYSHLMTVVWVSAVASATVLCFVVFPAVLRAERQADRTVFEHVAKFMGLKGFTIVLLCFNGFVLGFWGMVSGDWPLKFGGWGVLGNVGYRSALWWTVFCSLVHVAYLSTLADVILIGSILKLAARKRTRFQGIQRQID